MRGSEHVNAVGLSVSQSFSLCAGLSKYRILLHLWSPTLEKILYFVLICKTIEAKHGQYRTVSTRSSLAEHARKTRSQLMRLISSGRGGFFFVDLMLMVLQGFHSFH